jgi:membrane fusion protein (multidrug efflux system)
VVRVHLFPEASDKEYSATGKLLFSDMTVDPTTGAITLRAEFPNPKRELLSGTFVRVKIEQGIDEGALTVPQRASAPRRARACWWWVPTAR